MRLILFFGEFSFGKIWGKKEEKNRCLSGRLQPAWGIFSGHFFKINHIDFNKFEGTEALFSVTFSSENQSNPAQSCQDLLAHL